MTEEIKNTLESMVYANLRNNKISVLAYPPTKDSRSLENLGNIFLKRSSTGLNITDPETALKHRELNDAVAMLRREIEDKVNELNRSKSSEEECGGPHALDSFSI